MATKQQQITTMLDELVTGLRETIRVELRNCVSCGHFDATTEQCCLAGTRPPAHVIVSGCDAFSDPNEVPYV